MLIETVLRLPKIQSLSTYDVVAMDREIWLINKRLSAADPSIDLCAKNPYLATMDTVNTSIQTLYLLNSDTSAQILCWLLKKLRELRSFFMAFGVPKILPRRSDLTLDRLISLILVHSPKLEKLVLTVLNDMSNKQWRKYTGVKQFSDLRLL